jgi:hypothetical protein
MPRVRWGNLIKIMATPDASEKQPPHASRRATELQVGSDVSNGAANAR